MIGARDMKLMLMNRGIRSAVISNLRRARTGHDLVRGAEDAAATTDAQSPLQSDYVLAWPCGFGRAPRDKVAPDWRVGWAIPAPCDALWLYNSFFVLI